MSPRCNSTNLVVTTRKANFSAFNGYRRTPSDYSELRCLDCGHFWRSKSPSVASIRTATDIEGLRAI